MDADRVGTELAGYRIESVIGRGGMGIVYVAEHIRLSRRVALKVLPSEWLGDDRFRDRFVRESKLAASLDNPHIVDVYDAGEAGGVLYLAMRYVPGNDLKSVIRDEGPLAPERAVSLLTQVAAGRSLNASRSQLSNIGVPIAISINFDRVASRSIKIFKVCFLVIILNFLRFIHLAFLFL
jgi:serine/threonine protein kinase